MSALQRWRSAQRIRMRCHVCTCGRLGNRTLELLAQMAESRSRIRLAAGWAKAAVRHGDARSQ